MEKLNFVKDVIKSKDFGSNCYRKGFFEFTPKMEVTLIANERMEDYSPLKCPYSWRHLDDIEQNDTKDVYNIGKNYSNFKITLNANSRYACFDS